MAGIDASRQAFLERRLAEAKAEADVTANAAPPFAGERLSRADVEWLVADRAARGAEARGADTRGKSARGALADALDLRRAVLREGGDPIDLSGMILSRAQLDDADLAGANLRRTRLERANLYRATLAGVDLDDAVLTGANLSGASLKDARAQRARCEGAIFSLADLSGADFKLAVLDCADMRLACLKGTVLRTKRLSGAKFRRAHLEGADLQGAQLVAGHPDDEELARIRTWIPEFPRRLDAANLREAFFDSATILKGTVLAVGGDAVRVVDAHWNDVNLATVSWSHQFARRGARLGDEIMARRGQGGSGPAVDAEDMHDAVRANRQLAVTLRGQGLNEEADIFAYRAQLCQRDLLGRRVRQGERGSVGALLFSWFLWLLTGYGYRMKRIVFTYAIVVLAFAGAYYAFQGGPLPFAAMGHSGAAASLAAVWHKGIEALVLSVTAFHGRVFAGGFGAATPQGVVTAIEAIFGLVIEGVFIAMLTQRFFSR